MVLKGLHGKVAFAVQRVVEQASDTRHTYLELTGQFERSYLTAGLQEVAAYYSNRLSYEEVAGLLQRLTGERVLSDQRIEQLVIEKAVVLSQAMAEAAVVPGDEAQASLPKLNRQIDLYAAATPEVLLLEDGISVKAQKPTRQRRRALLAAPAKEEPSAKRIITDVIMLERRDGSYQYVCEGIDAQGNTLLSLEACVRRALQTEYGDTVVPLNIVAISDGARPIRQHLAAIFGVLPVLILDWYHLEKKTGELLSMIALNKADKERHREVILAHLWSGDTPQAIRYLQTEVRVRNAEKHQELIGYLERHQQEIIDYGARQVAGKTIGSGRMEKGVDQVIGQRQKHKAMSWSAKGSKALAILKVAELNGQWHELWFPQQPEEQAVA